MASEESGTLDNVSPIDLRLLALAVVLEPALSLARVSGLHLDDLQALVTSGYFREYQRRGMSLRAMRTRLGKSLRTLARLSKQAGEKGPPLAGSERVTWRRHIVAMLMSGPRSRDAVVQGLPGVSPSEIDEALDDLQALGVVHADESVYSVEAEEMMMVREDLDHRLDSLRHFLGSIAHVVYRRFFHTDDAEAFARVLSFSVDPKELPEVRDRIYRVLHDEVFAADAAAEGSPSAVQASVVLGIVETPTNLLWRPRG